MKSGKYLSAVLAILLFLAGADILLSSIRNPGHYADELILVGALLSAFALAILAWAFKLHARMKAMQRHLKGQ